MSSDGFDEQAGNADRDARSRGIAQGDTFAASMSREFPARIDHFRHEVEQRARALGYDSEQLEQARQQVERTIRDRPLTSLAAAAFAGFALARLLRR